jgi:Fe-S oxidoreductase
MEQLGATELLVACPNCYRTIKKTSPGIHVRSIYEVMEETLAEQGNCECSRSPGGTFALHDPCAGRWESAMHESVRALIKRAGFSIHEMEYSKQDTHCCGMGGMVAFANPGLVTTITNNRIGEVPADVNMVTYCATCRDTFGKTKPTLHLLDLLFNANWQDTINQPNPSQEQKTTNQKILKAKIMETYICPRDV